MAKLFHKKFNKAKLQEDNNEDFSLLTWLHKPTVKFININGYPVYVHWIPGDCPADRHEIYLTEDETLEVICDHAEIDWDKITHHVRHVLAIWPLWMT